MGLNVQTGFKVEGRWAGFPPAPPIEEVEDTEKELKVRSVGDENRKYAWQVLVPGFLQLLFVC
jgi:hypothetical protein